MRSWGAVSPWGLLCACRWTIGLNRPSPRVSYGAGALRFVSI
jgi:hypothetical protein